MTLIKKESPQISIITAVYNGEIYLRENIESVVNQSYPHVEYLIIDGGSKDNTLEIIKGYKNQIDYWLSEPDQGIYDAFNKAVNKAKGEWLCFIGADDFLWSNEVLNNIVPHLNEAKLNDIRYVYGQINLLHPISKEIIEVLGKPWVQQKDKFQYSMSIAHCGSFHHKNLFLEHGEFNTQFKIAGDYDFLLREFKTSNKDAYFVEGLVVVGMRNGGISGSLNQRLVMARETEMARRKNGLDFISWEIYLWIVRIKGLLFFEKIFGRKFSEKLADMYRTIKGEDKRWSN